jgi:hypothetical protein
MTLAVAWIVFPLVLAAVTLGCGLALEAVAGTRLPFALLLPAGLAAAVVVMCLATLTDATAELAVPLIVGYPMKRQGSCRISQLSSRPKRRATVFC